MLKTKILVATHKEYDYKIFPTCYLPIKVGNFSKTKADGYLCDNVGDNISDKNDIYCELTALYWGWKNFDADISGLCHYRRYFVSTLKTFKNYSTKILDENKIISLLKHKKIILPKLGYRNINQPKLYDNTKKNNQDFHLMTIDKIIKSEYNEYTKSWIKYAYGNKVSWGNMFIAKMEYYKEYCEWVFPLLFKLEKAFKEKGKLEPRIMGFVSELLLCVWADTRFKKKDITYLPVINTEAKEKHTFVKRILRVLNLYNLIQSIGFKIKYLIKHY